MICTLLPALCCLNKGRINSFAFFARGSTPSTQMCQLAARLLWPIRSWAVLDCHAANAPASLHRLRRGGQLGHVTAANRGPHPESAHPIANDHGVMPVMVQAAGQLYYLARYLRQRHLPPGRRVMISQVFQPTDIFSSPLAHASPHGSV
jgi:hypothetical protein